MSRTLSLQNHMDQEVTNSPRRNHSLRNYECQATSENVCICEFEEYQYVAPGFVKTLDDHGRWAKIMGSNVVALLQTAACEIIFSLHFQHWALSCSEVGERKGLHILPSIVSNASQHQIDLSEN